MRREAIAKAMNIAAEYENDVIIAVTKLRELKKLVLKPHDTLSVIRQIDKIIEVLES